MSHKIIFGHSDGVSAAYEYSGTVRRAAVTALNAEGVNVSCEINVSFMNNDDIRELNREMRSVDSATDVLSFPMYELTPGAFEAKSEYLDPGTSRLPLGDMALNIEKIKAQATEFGHSPSREAAYLTVHSVLHLLGYDHLDEGEEKRRMRAREKAIMALLGLPEKEGGE